MSDTPRTDAKKKEWIKHKRTLTNLENQCYYAWKHAFNLERELTTLQSERDRLVEFAKAWDDAQLLEDKYWDIMNPHDKLMLRMAYEKVNKKRKAIQDLLPQEGKE